MNSRRTYDARTDALAHVLIRPAASSGYQHALFLHHACRRMLLMQLVGVRSEDLALNT